MYNLSRIICYALYQQMLSVPQEIVFAASFQDIFVFLRQMFNFLFVISQCGLSLSKICSQDK